MVLCRAMPGRTVPHSSLAVQIVSDYLTRGTQYQDHDPAAGLRYKTMHASTPVTTSTLLYLGNGSTLP